MNLNIYQSITLIDMEKDKTYEFSAGKRSITNLLPEYIHVKLIDHEHIEIKWKKYTWIISSEVIIKYWFDGFTGCEYNSYDKIKVGTNNQHMLECAYEVLEELETLVNEKGVHRVK